MFRPCTYTHLEDLLEGGLKLDTDGLCVGDRLLVVELGLLVRLLCLEQRMLVLRGRGEGSVLLMTCAGDIKRVRNTRRSKAQPGNRISEAPGIRVCTAI